MRIARLLDAGGRALLPTLFDVQLISAKPDMMTLSGTERLPTDTGTGLQTFGQTWVLTPGSVHDEEQRLASVSSPN